MRRPVLAAAALVALAVVLAALPIGSDVYEGGEAREGLVVREMLRTGDWILPLWNGSIVPSKPPLFHWLAAGAAGLTGAGVTEHTLRAPSIVLAGLVVLLVFLAGRAWGGEQVGFLAALVLATTPQFLNEAGDGRVDMTLTTAITGAQLAFVHALRGGGGPTRIVLALCLALAMLAKGPVGPGLVGLTALVSALANRRLGPALRLVRPLPVFVFLAVAGGWYGLAYHHRGMDFVAKQIVSENGEALLGARASPTARPSSIWRRSSWAGSRGRSSCPGRSRAAGGAATSRGATRSCGRRWCSSSSRSRRSSAPPTSCRSARRSRS